MKQKGKIRSILELFATFFKIGLFTFGGGYAMISLIERETVENKKWVTSDDIVDMVAIAESTPGVIAVNSATFVGFKIAGFWGSVAATFGVVLPSLVVITVLSQFIDVIRTNDWVNAAFRGIRAGVVVLIFNAVAKLIRPMEKNWLTVGIALLVFGVATFLQFDVVWLILGGILFGIVAQSIRYRKTKASESVVAESTHAPQADEAVTSSSESVNEAPSLRKNTESVSEVPQRAENDGQNNRAVPTDAAKTEEERK